MMTPTSVRLIQVSLPHATFGIVAAGGTIVDAAPIARWTVGHPERHIAAYYRRKGARLVVIDCEMSCAESSAADGMPVLRTRERSPYVVAWQEQRTFDIR